MPPDLAQCWPTTSSTSTRCAGKGFAHAINVFEAVSEAEARALHDAHPLARHGFFRIGEVYAWQQVF